MTAPAGASASAAVTTAPDGQPRVLATNLANTSVAELGRVTYTRYLWAIELAGTLLLVAAGGAIIIAQREPHTAQSTGVSAS
jgi:NADH:ubiquinone oxidoreductase subunit 6 (subunit J)